MSSGLDRAEASFDMPLDPPFGRPGRVIRYGHWGRPVLVFPSEAGRAGDFEERGMLEAVRPLVEAGRVKLYCVDAADERTWSDRSIGLEDRARGHLAYERWLTEAVVPWIGQDTPGAHDAVVTGVSMGAFHALLLSLRRPDLFPVSICLSGNYDPSLWHAWGDRGDTAYELNPTWFVPGLHGGHLDWLRSRMHVVLCVGQGPFETEPTQALPSTRHLAGLLRDKGIRVDHDEWGQDAAHDWPWWQRQLPHHLSRFC